MSKNIKIILVILLVGILYRLALTANGNFLFNMDNARDLIDVREMVELGKIRLTGPTSAVEGLYNGPLWYYLLAIPYIVSGGDSYSAIIMEIILWAIGGFFLLKLIKNYSSWLILPIGLVWVASNYIVLQNLYAFNPNPVTFLTPLFIYGLVEYLKKGKRHWIILAWFLGGAFFNFEMNFGIFTPLIIFLSLFFVNRNYFKDKYFWLGVLVFVGSLLPQILFDFKHQFIMSKAVIKFISENKGSGLNFAKKIQIILDSFFSVFSATLMNQKLLSWGILLLSIPAFKKLLSKNIKDTITIVSSLFILVPFFGYLIIPVTVNAWHLGAESAASLILIAFILSSLWKINFFGKIFSIILSILLIFYALSNILNYFMLDRGKSNMDPSLYKNEVAAIDYVYKYANGQNFKVYTYLPSVYDYPYQYLFWWYGNKKYGYVSGEYAYSPNKPQYISNKEKFEGKKDNFSGLVFLIKEPDRIRMRQAWENDYKDMEFISKEMVGPLEVEIRREIKKS